jgi:hypothetical protein
MMSPSNSAEMKLNISPASPVSLLQLTNQVGEREDEKEYRTSDVKALDTPEVT